MPDYFWAALWGALAANAITVLVVYLAVSHHRGSPMLQTGARAINGIAWLGLRVLQLYIALIFLGGVAYAIKLLILGGG